MNNLDSFVKEFNKNYIQKELTENEILFDNIDEKKLDIQQREAVIVDEDNNLVLAGAGSGKTLTIVAKVKYLIERKKIKPEEILLISFTKKTTEELTERLNKLGINLTAKTFHKLGLDIIVNNQGNRPDISESLSPVIDNYFNQNISKDNEKINKLLHYFAYYLNIPKSLDEFDNLGECYDFFRNTDFETFKGKVELQKEMQQKKIKKETFRGEIVKSLEELLIANFLYLNGIDYIYEYKYPFISEDKYKKQYKPDFYLTEYDIYLEHFGVNENNQAPWLSKIEEKKYLESIIWKRNFHKKNGTKLLETYSYYNKNRMLTEKLKEILIRNNIKLNPIDAKDVFNDIFNNKNNQFKEFKKLIATFINLFKANNYSVNNFKILEDKTSKFQDSYLKTRTFLFLDFIKPILLDYEESLKINNSIDFNDMINKATAIIKDEKLLMPYKYILVDEFQDISFSRYSLLKEIKNTTSAKIVCVGDDWQSIYRFTGSDIDLFVNFKKYFGYYELLKIENTYRNSQELIDIAGAFIMNNSKQFKKNLKSAKHHSKPVRLVSYDDKPYNEIMSILNEIYQINPLGTVTILGRNNFDIDYVINDDIDTSRTLSVVKSGDTVNIKYKTYPSLVINFMTVHKSKGLEADNVIIINLENKLVGFPNKISDDPVLSLVLTDMDNFDFAEERRLFYVALTRTKNITYLLTPKLGESIFTEELSKKFGLKKYSYKEKQELKKPLNCPVCQKGQLVIRINSKDYNQFLGCSNYPKCDYTYKNLELLNNQYICPSCGGYMIKRTTSTGDFYGCTNYPVCRSKFNEEY